MEKKLEVKDLHVSFRTQGGIVKAVRGISFDLYKGETLAIVGESGSGKSVTSKAIIGILAKNSIVEAGEILYDGHDLLKVDEEHFHKIRGDKISMIFQDPLSSLNPIVRIGKQLTEAMILNGIARQKNAKKDFNRYLKLLNKNLDEVKTDKVAENAAQCKTFDDFCIYSTKLELAYNDAHSEAVSLKAELENLMFLIEKRQKVDYKGEIKKAAKSLALSRHRYVVEDVTDYVSKLNEFATQGNKNINPEELYGLLKEIYEVLDAGVKKQCPNFFRLGFYLMKNPNANLDSYSVEELDSITRKYLDDNFMNNFIDLASIGMKNAFDKSIAVKKLVLGKKDKYLSFFNNETFNKKEAYTLAKELAKDVKAAINYLDIHKKGVEYSFESTILHGLDRYYFGIANNPKMQKKYDRQLAKYNKIVESGKNPTWQVNPAVIVDLDLAKKNIQICLNNLFNSYQNDINNYEKYDVKAATIELIDNFKELASRVVFKMTKSLAKARAIELMKEVGIPEPTIRFRQYPFEFSGGMRQRIVIAIALSANPDILICDEPTTALDVTIQSQILELINKIKRERNLSVIFITHDLGVVANMADRIAVMYAGKIVEYGTSEDIFYDPRHPYTWALLSSMPDLDTKEKLDAIPGTPPNMIYPPKGDAFAERNKYALEIDFEMQPPMFEVSDTHFAATWLLHPNAPKVNPPKIITDRIERMKGRAN